MPAAQDGSPGRGGGVVCLKLFLSETLGYRSIEKGGAQTSLRVVRGRAESQGRETNLHYRGLLSPLGSDLQSAYL